MTYILMINQCFSREIVCSIQFIVLWDVQVHFSLCLIHVLGNDSRLASSVCVLFFVLYLKVCLTIRYDITGDEFGTRKPWRCTEE